MASEHDALTVDDLVEALIKLRKFTRSGLILKDDVREQAAFLAGLLSARLKYREFDR